MAKEKGSRHSLIDSERVMVNSKPERFGAGVPPRSNRLIPQRIVNVTARDNLDFLECSKFLYSMLDGDR